jgi:hypothetical protein
VRVELDSPVNSFDGGHFRTGESALAGDLEIFNGKNGVNSPMREMFDSIEEGRSK